MLLADSKRANCREDRMKRDAVFDPFAMVFEGKELDLLSENSD
jgi:hypothetical protein